MTNPKSTIAAETKSKTGKRSPAPPPIAPRSDGNAPVPAAPAIQPAASRSKSTAAAQDKPAAPPRATKIARVIALLQRKQGATLNEIVKETGWQPHTARASLTGLKKKGHVIERVMRGTLSCYRIVKAGK